MTLCCLYDSLILEMDSQTIASRVSMRTGDGHDVPFAEQVGCRERGSIPMMPQAHTIS